MKIINHEGLELTRRKSKILNRKGHPSTVLRAGCVTRRNSKIFPFVNLRALCGFRFCKC